MLKKTLVLICFIFSTINYAQYTTPNTGINWSLDSLVSYSGGVVTGSFPNYAISNKINVSANDRIFILPGSIVTISGSTSGFDVAGKFLAVGNAVDSIIFTSSTTDSTGGAYNGFYFTDTSVDSACIISYARIEYAYYGFRCLNASPTLSNSYLWKCRRGVNLSSSSSPIISHNRIERSYEYGITLTTGSSPLIEWNELINNNSQNSSAKNQISIGTQGNNSPTILHNKIYGGMFNRTGGISISTLIGGSSSSSEIAYNEIYNNSFGIAMTGSSPITCYIHDNLIYNNNINPDVMAAGSGINAYGTAVISPVITKNTIYGNWWGVTIQIGIAGQPGPQINLGNITNVDTTDDGMNIIYDNIQGVNVYDLYNNTREIIYAQNNDWGVYDSTSIESHVFHSVDDTSLGTVLFMPFSTSLPVELVSFEATVNNSTISLNWQTASEINNKGFEVERKQVGNEEWEVVGFVNGKGTTSEQQSYSFNDRNITNGKYLYQLKQIDFDGSFTLSNIVEVSFMKPNVFSLEQNYPNPFNPSTTIRFTVGDTYYASPALVTLRIYDMLGSEVTTLVNEVKAVGEYKVDFDASYLASGIYYYQLKAGSFIQTNKMILIK